MWSASLHESVRRAAAAGGSWPDLRARLDAVGVLGLQTAGEREAALVAGAALAATGSVLPGLRLALEDAGQLLPAPGAERVGGIAAATAAWLPAAGDSAAWGTWWRGAAAACLGACEELIGRAQVYARDRVAFGRPIGAFQVQRHRLAELAARIAALRALVTESAGGEDREAAVAFAAAAGTARFVADEVLQLHGGFGYAEESGIAAWWRELHEVDALLAPPARVLVESTAPAARAAGARPQVAEAGRALLAEHVVPHVEEWEAAGDFPRELFRTVGAAGLFGLKFDPRWGGSGPDPLAQATWVQELARVGAGGLAADLGAHSDLACLYLDRAGSDAQRERWLVPSLRGELIGALGVTEPDAGSDVAGIRTRARRDGDGWVLDGAKTYITNGAWCDYVVVAAKTDPAQGHAGITLFVVEAGMPGFTRRRLRMLGWRTSHTGELAFDGVRLGDEHRLGEVGRGFYAIMANFVWERVSMSLGAAAAAERCLVAARAAGGAATEIAALEVDVAAGRALADEALRVHLAERADPSPAGQPGTAVRTAAMAKLVTQRLALRTAHLAYRLAPDSPAERWLRDARLGPIGGGTDEIMRELISRGSG